MTAIAAVGFSAIAAAPAAADWEEPFSLSPLGGSRTQNPAVAAYPDGSFVAAWERALPDPEETAVIEARKIGADGSAGPLLPMTENDGRVANAHVATGPAGSAIVTWNRIVAPQQIAIEARRIAADGTLGPVVTVSEPMDESLRSDVAFDSAGNATVGWIHQIVDSAVLKVRQLPADGPAGQTHTLTRTVDGVTDEVALAIGPDRRPLVAYTQFGQIKAQRLSPTGEPEPGVFELTKDDDTSAYLSIGMDAAGLARVGWGRTDPNPLQVSTRTVAADGTLGGRQLVSPADRRVVLPQIAVNGAGAAVFVWQDTPLGADPETVQAGTLLADGTLAAQLRLSDPSFGGGMNPRVGIDAAGIATAVWQRGTGGTVGVVEAARFSAGGAESRVAELSTPVEVLPYPDVAVAPGGLALAIWVQKQTGDEDDNVRLTAARFVPPPDPTPPSPPVPPDPPAPPPEPIAKCADRRASIVGTSQDDVIVGTPGPDVIDGGRGDDRINGKGGADRICGRAGDDEIRGSRGRDRALGGNGEDSVLGGRGRDTLFGGPQDDFLDGGRARNRCNGGAGVNVLVRCGR